MFMNPKSLEAMRKINGNIHEITNSLYEYAMSFPEGERDSALDGMFDYVISDFQNLRDACFPNK